MNQKRAFVLAALLGLVAATLAWLLLSLGRAGDTPVLATYKAQYVDGPAMLNLAETLSSDALQGRGAGTAGNEAARGFILKRFETLELRKLRGTYLHPFTILPDAGDPDGRPRTGANIVGWIAGETPGKGPVIVLSAHYDHLGMKDGEIYNGADDNASGTSALVAVAEYFTRHPPAHDLVFAAVDAEEIGHLGSKDFVRTGLVDPERIALNINFDMVSRSEAGELYVAGTSHYPQLLPLVQDLAESAPVTLLTGHDTPDLGADDWTQASDHASFHDAGIPFLYFGVEDHEAYHKPTDDYSEITHDFYLRAGDMLVMATLAADDWLGELPAE